MNPQNLREISPVLKKLIDLVSKGNPVEFSIKSKFRVMGTSKLWELCDYDNHNIDFDHNEYRAVPEVLTTYTMVTLGKSNGKLRYGSTFSKISSFNSHCMQSATYFLETKIYSDGTIKNARYNRYREQLKDTCVLLER